MGAGKDCQNSEELSLEYVHIYILTGAIDPGGLILCRYVGG